MSSQHIPYLLFLAVSAVLIWVRDLSWMNTAEDTLPVLVGLPLFVWLGTWNFRPGCVSPPIKKVMIGIAMFFVGAAIDLIVLMAAGWTWMLYSWLAVNLSEEGVAKARRLMILPLMAFPWIAVDFQPVAWWFRLTGAHVTAFLFEVAGFDVVQDGVNVLIDGLPISVEAACSGMHALQSMLLAGSVVAFIVLEKSKSYFWNIPVLFALSWFANTLRIILITLGALIAGREFAMGQFHEMTGWIVLFTMFVFSYLVFSAIAEVKDGE